MTDPDKMFADGAAYERLMGRFSQPVGADFLAWLRPGPGLAWLDAGCGNGAFTEVIARDAAPASLDGIDPAEAQLAYARARPGTALARFHQGDAQALPFGDGQFDMAVMGLVIAFLPDPARGLAELVRVTRPGGWVATYMWDLPRGLPLFPLFRALAAMGQPGQMPPSSHLGAAGPLETLWRGAGLQDVALTTIPLTVRFADFEEFWTSSTAMAGPQAAAVKALTPDQREDLRARLQADLPRDASGAIAYPALAHAIRGRVPG